MTPEPSKIVHTLRAPSTLFETNLRVAGTRQAEHAINLAIKADVITPAADVNVKPSMQIPGGTYVTADGGEKEVFVSPNSAPVETKTDDPKNERNPDYDRVLKAHDGAIMLVRRAAEIVTTKDLHAAEAVGSDGGWYVLNPEDDQLWFVDRKGKVHDDVTLDRSDTFPVVHFEASAWSAFNPQLEQTIEGNSASR